MSSDPVETPDLQATVRYLMKEVARLQRALDSMVHAQPAMMSTPDGLLPVNSTGMRHCVDEWVRWRYQATGEISSGDALRIALGID